MQAILRFCLIGCCLGFHFCLAAAAEAPASAGSTNNAAGGEPAFADPFAVENAPAHPQLNISDPLESVNRRFFWFNDKLYFWALRPGARAYSKVAPGPVRSSVQRFFANTRYPVRFVNNVLQGRAKSAGQETARFVLNSTLGLAGFFDPARELKLKPQPADLDQTLGVYGIRPGVYLDWPILGPRAFVVRSG